MRAPPASGEGRVVVAIEDKSLPDNSTRLVPVSSVAGATKGGIKLNCTRAEVAKLGAFVVSDFVPQSPSGEAYTSGAAYTARYVVDDTAYDEFQEQEIPEGELALYSGMHVEALDGRVGKLDELVVDPRSGRITGLLMRKGHLWGSRHVTVPIGQIKFVDGDGVYLKLEKAAVGELPSMNVRPG
jgi:sporulation protein YlmC with PRC-barrel domain